MGTKVDADTACRKSYELTVIIAEEMALANLPEIFKRLKPERYPDVEFLLCSGSSMSLLVGVPDEDNVRIVQTSRGSRIPLLWRDGIRAARAEKVALTTAHCIPSETWLDQLLTYSLDGNQVAFGGAIANIENDNSIGRMVYLLRYVRFTNVKENGSTDDIAADNAIYRKADILEHDDLLEVGFWEPSFHRRFLNEGKVIQFDNTLLMVHKNCYSARQFICQRYSHGVEFGKARRKLLSPFRRMAMIGLSPLIPVIFIMKIMATARCDKKFSFGFNRDILWLLVFVLAWSAGETIGYIEKD